MTGISFAAAVAAAPASAAAQASAQPSAAEIAKRAQIKQTAGKFETQFLSIMMQQMFEGLDTNGPFSGGPGEAMFRSFMTDAMAKNITNAGGVGLTDTINREMLKLQGLN